MDLDSLRILNPWWESPKAIREDLHLKPVLGKPYYFDNPVKKRLPLDPGRTYVLRGGRQVGKTTLLKEKILEAINGGIPTDQCLFLSCEAIGDFRELQKILVGWIGPRKRKPWILCLDEITFVPEWQRALLWLNNAGLLRPATTFLTGSNSRDLKQSAERFPGRRVQEAKIYPLMPADYRSLPCFSRMEPDELLNLFFRVGGYPHAVRDFYELGAVSDETFETYANWIFGDAHRFHLSRDILEHILFRIFETLGSQVTWQRLVEKSPVKSHETAASYVDHLELAFLCHVLPCYDPEKKMPAPRKAKKIYFVDPLLYAVVGGYLRGFRNVASWWANQLSLPEFCGRLFEAVAIGTAAHSGEEVNFWYSSGLKREVDLLIRRGDQMRLYEVKSAGGKIAPRALGQEVHVVTPQTYWNELVNTPFPVP